MLGIDGPLPAALRWMAVAISTRSSGVNSQVGSVNPPIHLFTASRSNDCRSYARPTQYPGDGDRCDGGPMSLRAGSQGITQGKVALQIRTAQIRCPRNFVVSLAQLTRGVDMLLAAEPLLSLAVTVTSEQRVESVLRNIVQGLALQPGLALARIWLLPSADLCGSGREPSRSPEQTECLRLVASAGSPVNSPGEDWSWKSWGSCAGWVIRRRFGQPRPGNRSMIGGMPG
jgi:hypothetical protein